MIIANNLFSAMSDMQALDRVQPGPDDHTQLTWQPDHRSTPLWRCATNEGGLDPRIMQYIDAADLIRLFKVPDMEVDHALITALVEWWRPETHTFHLPHGEMGITLQDMEVMLGITVDELLVIGRKDMQWNVVCQELLGHEPSPVISNSNKSTLIGARIKYKWLDAQFATPLAADAGDELGSAALAWLYRQLCSASKKDAMQIGGALLLVQLWAYLRFPRICLIARLPLSPVHSGPLAIRWSGPKCTAEHATHVLAAYQTSLATLRAEQIVWEPYTHTLGSLPASCTAGQHIWRAEVPLIYFWIVEGHHPKRVFRQFGMKQLVPLVVDTSTALHKRSLQGKWEKD
ncbi:hypothetical protein SO802_011183 [Lithocarpus litseifolius]|uniref:Aminotransferase-like plant mobile domain-containing protein n=1 Tax=Lithocarpus litseifolius TaxID=425828 RepID=A0AAW2CZ80_9ROSI